MTSLSCVILFWGVSVLLVSIPNNNYPSKIVPYFDSYEYYSFLYLYISMSIAFYYTVSSGYVAH